MTRVAPAAFAYIETTIPAGVTVDEFRRSLPRRPTRFQRLIGALRPARPRS